MQQILRQLVAGVMLVCAFIVYGNGVLAAEGSFKNGSNGSKPVFSGGGVDAGLNTLKGEVEDAGVLTEGSLIKVILDWVKFALAFLAVFAFVAFIWAGALYITAFMNEENAESAKKVMIWAAIGIIIILLSYALTNVLISASVNG